MSLTSSGIDLLEYKWIVRGFDDVHSTYKPVKEEFINTRSDLDQIVNNMVDSGLFVMVIPTHMVDGLDILKSSINI